MKKMNKDSGNSLNDDTLQDNADIAAFHQAVKTMYYDKAKAFLDSDQSLSRSADSFGIPAIINATSKADIDMLSLLFLNGADINQRGHLDETALICAVRNGFKEKTAFLLSVEQKPMPKPRIPNLLFQSLWIETIWKLPDLSSSTAQRETGLGR